MADSFNINVKDVDTGGNFLNSSRGASSVEPTAAVKSSGGLGETLSGVGDLFKNVVSGIDQTIKQDINDQLYRQTDQVFNEVGVGDVGIANSSPDTPPKALVGAFDNLQRVKDAMDNGAISKTNFDGRLVSVAQQLRYQYSGHREYIDDMMNKITGIRPQHQVYMDLMEESNKRVSAAQKEQTQYMAAFHQYGPYLSQPSTNPQDLRKNYPTVESMAVDAMPVLKARADLDASNKTLEFNLKQQGADEGNAKRMITDNMWAHFNVAQAATAQMIGGPDGVTKFAQEYTAKPDPTALSTFVGQFKARNATVTEQVSNAVRQRIAEARLPPSAFGEIMAPFKENMKMQEDALAGGDFSIFKMQAVKNQAIKDGATGVVLGNDDFALMGAVNTNLGSEAVKIMQASSPVFRNAVATAGAWQNMLKVMSNKRSGLIDTIDPINKLSPEERQATLDTVQALVKSPTNTQEFKSRAVNFLYGPKNVGLMGGVTEADRKVLWTKMTDPTIVNEMKKGSGMQYETYSQWVMNEFRDTFQRDMTGLIERTKTEAGQVLRFDDKTNRYVLGEMEIPNIKGQFSTNPADNKAAIKRNAVRAQDMYIVDGVNAGLKAMEPILKEKGLDIQSYIQGSYGSSALPGIGPDGKKTDKPMKLGADNPHLTTEASQAMNKAAEDGFSRYFDNAQMSPVDGIEAEIRDLMSLYVKKPDPDTLASIHDLLAQKTQASTEKPPVQRAEPVQATIGNTTSVSKTKLKN